MDWPTAISAESKNAHGISLIAEDTPPILQPNDPGYDSEWGTSLYIPKMLGEQQQEMQGNGLNAQTVYVVVLDGGIISHPDLDANRARQFDRDFTGTPWTDPDLGSHATGVASICAVGTNNAMGAASIAGFTGTVKVISVRMFDTDGHTTLPSQIEALNYIASLVDQGVNVVAVACAFGGEGEVSLEREAIKRLTDRGIAIFAGAGQRTVTSGFYPASYAVTNSMVVAVGSLNAAGDASSWGTIFAPTDVNVIIKRSQPDWVASFGGVSASTGQPAATYALIRSLFPSLTPMNALRRLLFSAGPLAPGIGSSFPDTSPFGKLNSYMATTKRLYLVGARGTASEAIALDAINSTTGPFAVRSHYLTNLMSEQPTRIMFFAYNLDATTAPSTITVTAQDSFARVYNLPVESVSSIADLPFVANIVVVLPEILANVGNVQVTLSINGQTSNQLNFVVH